MKTIFPLATLVASLICFGATPLHAQNQRAAPGTSVAVIDINHIFKNHTRFKGAMDGIKADIQAFEAHLNEERKKITLKTEQLKNLPAGSQDYKRLEEELASVHTQLQLETGRKRKEILDREARVYYNAYKEIEQKVAVFADSYGVGLVLRFSSEDMDPTKRDSVLAGVNRAIVFQRNLNITNDILNELNRSTPPANNRTTNPGIPGRPGTTVPR